jgi:hypothetical protein
VAQFQRYVGIDYSGAQVPTASLPGLQVFVAGRDGEPTRVPPPPSPRKYWTRRGIAEWLVTLLGEGVPTVVGIDHAFGFPIEYFDRYGLPRDWRSFSTISSGTGPPTTTTSTSTSCAMGGTATAARAAASARGAG